MCKICILVATMNDPAGPPLKQPIADVATADIADASITDASIADASPAARVYALYAGLARERESDAPLSGIDSVAALFGIDRSVVFRWSRPPSVGGTGGLVPAKYHTGLILTARDLAPERKPDPEIFLWKPGEQGFPVDPVDDAAPGRRGSAAPTVGSN